MQAHICTTCGTQYAPAPGPPDACKICLEERQFVLPSGQNWTTLEKLRRTHMTTVRQEGEFIGVGTAPNFGIGQRALLVRTPAGNVLWDCIALLDPSIIDLIKASGGLAAIAISHPHYYTTMVEWSRAFGDAPVYLHEADREWVMRPDPCIQFWSGGTKELLPGVSLIRVGGHFEGGTILHYAQASGGKGALLSGDLLQVVPDGRHVAFMRSYPNFIPLGEVSVRNIAKRMEGWRYEAIYGAWWDRVIAADAEKAMSDSVARHIHWLQREV